MSGNFRVCTFWLVIALLSLVHVRAKDLYVAVDGNDGVTYTDNNKDNPWQSIIVGVYNLKAGDTLYIRGGTYLPEYTMYTKSDYTSKANGVPIDMNAESGTAESPVTIRNFPGEQVIIDLQNVAQFIGLDNKHYWVFEGLTFYNSQTVFHVGYDMSSTHHTFRNLRVTASQGGDNAGAIKLEGNAEYTTIEYCVLTGPGTSDSVHLNTSSIYVTRVNNLWVRNNRLTHAPFGLYFKHANDGSEEEVNIVIENNIFEDHSRRSLETNANYSLVQNNLFGLNNAGIRNNEANGYTGGDFNTYQHNTFFNSTITFSGDTQGDESYPGSIGIVLEGNIFTGQLHLHPYSDLATSLTGSNNLFNGTAYSKSFNLEQTVQDLIENSNVTGSLFGTPLFAGTDFSNPLSFALESNSPGKQLDNGIDAGIDVTNLGPAAGLQPVMGTVIKIVH